MVSTVVCTMRSYPVDVETCPSARVVTLDVLHATSRDVVKSGNEMVVVPESVKGGRM